MAVAFRSSSTAANQTASTFSVTKPSGAADGDWLVALQETGLAGGANPATPTNWTLLGRVTHTFSGNDLACFIKAVSGDGASYTFNNAAGGLSPSSSVRITCWSGATTPTQITTNTGSSASATASEITTTADNSYLLGGFGTGAGAASTITPTFGTDLGTIGVFGNALMGSAYVLQASAGPSGNKTATLDNSAAWGALLVAIPPPTPAAKGGTAAMMGI